MVYNLILHYIAQNVLSIRYSISAVLNFSEATTPYNFTKIFDDLFDITKFQVVTNYYD